MHRAFAGCSLLFVLFLATTHDVPAQEVTQLQQGVPIERSIAPGQTHLYTINLEEGQFLQLVVAQRGIDVIIHVTDPNRKNLGDFDSPNGDSGPENVSFAAATSGVYVIRVNPLNQGEDLEPGKYEIKIVELRQATDQELSAVSDQEELKAKAVALVKEALLTIPQIRSISIRIHAQLQAGGLLWTTDEKAASKLMSDAVASLKEYIAGIDLGDPDSATDFQSATILRYELIQALAPHDPEMALSFLRSTRIVPESEGDDRGGRAQEDQIELSLADQIAARDPKRAFQIAQESLKTRLSSNLFPTVMRLRTSEPELARKLSRDIVAKLQDEKIIANREALELALSLARATRNPTRRRQGVAPREGAEVSLLSDQELRDILQKILHEALAYSTSSTASNWNGRDVAITALSGLKEFSQDLERFVPGSSAALDKRLAEMRPAADPRRATWEKLQNTLNNAPLDTVPDSINRAPAEVRDQLFQQLAERTAAAGDLVRAKQILTETLSNPWQRRQALNNLEQQFIHQSVAKGRIEDALRSVATLRPAKARATVIGQIAGQIGPGRKQAAALNLLEQARSLLNESPVAEDQEEMYALLELAGAFARYDSKRAFEILEPLIDQFNEINDAARKLSGFGQESYSEGELILHNGNTMANMVTQINKALSAVSSTNFERTKAAIARIQAPEVRLVANIEVSRQILQRLP